MYRTLGAHPDVVDGAAGTRFAVWAPNAADVSVVCNANGWKPGQNRLWGSDSGIWSGFVPGMKHGDVYKYVHSHARRPLAREVRPGRLLRRGAAPHRLHRLPAARFSLAGRQLDAEAGAHRLVRAADLDLRSAPGLVEAAKRWTPLLQLPRAGQAARRLHARDGLHAPAAHAACANSPSTARGATRPPAISRPPAASARPKTSCTSSITATRPTSA